MSVILCKKILRWLERVRRMNDVRIRKQLLFGELAQGGRPRGRPKLRFKDTWKSSMMKCHIDVRKWEGLAEERLGLKSARNKRVKRLEKDLSSSLVARRQRRKQDKMPQQNGTSLTRRFCSRNCASNIGKISHKRSCSISIFRHKLNF